MFLLLQLTACASAVWLLFTIITLGLTIIVGRVAIPIYMSIYCPDRIDPAANFYALRLARRLFDNAHVRRAMTARVGWTISHAVVVAISAGSSAIAIGLYSCFFEPLKQFDTSVAVLFLWQWWAICAYIVMDQSLIEDVAIALLPPILVFFVSLFFYSQPRMLEGLACQALAFATTGTAATFTHLAWPTPRRLQ
ncbi:MAG TPA: hypothetical protein VGE52_16645 [Pirellulales bacterium]